MDGFTGINIERARQDIDNFFKSAVNACEKCSTAFANLTSGLCLYWASPKAAEYTKVKSDQLWNIIVQARQMVDHIVSGAVDAANILAKNNGLQFNYEINTFSNNPDWSYSYCEESKNGIVGMDIEGVKYLLTQFDNDVKAALALLDSVPNGIAFYDAEGTLINKYNDNLDNFKNDFSEVVISTRDDINKYMETEQHTIFVAKQNATQTMTG